jgi:hypothetical protein
MLPRGQPRGAGGLSLLDGRTKLEARLVGWEERCAR